MKTKKITLILITTIILLTYTLVPAYADVPDIHYYDEFIVSEIPITDGDYAGNTYFDLNFQSNVFNPYWVFGSPAVTSTVTDYGVNAEITANDLAPGATTGLPIRFSYYPLGNVGVSFSLLPQGTNLTFTGNLGIIKTINGQSSYVYGHSCNFALHAYNSAGTRIQTVYGDNTFTFEDTKNYTFNIKYSFTNTANVAYVVPEIYMTTNITAPPSNHGLIFTHGESRGCDLYINTLFLEHQQALMSWAKILNAQNETNDWLEKILEAIDGGGGSGSGADDKREEADELIADLDSMEKPDVDDAYLAADPFSVVGSDQFGNFTLYVSNIVDMPIISQMITLSVIVAFISYVLFGKKR